jgi:hypothetical protein
MSGSLKEFASSSNDEFAYLKRQIDLLSNIPDDYFFSSCELLPGCKPLFARLGFYRKNNEYVMYVFPRIVYRGNKWEAKILFANSGVRFNCFADMRTFIKTLGKSSE